MSPQVQKAKAAVYVWTLAADYAAQGGGSMDYWDVLPEHARNLCRDLVRDIESSPPEAAAAIRARARGEG